ncbi:phage protein [Staphylococcus aureus]|nr:phage protein [Staphylococcus aureus]
MTEFTLIYDKFLSKLTDFSLARLDKDVLESDLQERLITALSDFAQLPEEKTEVDLSTKTFTNGLSVEEQNIIATLMVINYLDKYILSEDNMRILLTSKDYKQYSQAALLKELKATKSEYQSDVDAKLNSYSFRQKFRKKKKDEQ